MSAINWQLNYDIRYLMFLITPNYLSQDTEFDSRKNKCKTSILGVKVSELVSCMRDTHHLATIFSYYFLRNYVYVYIFYTWVFFLEYVQTKKNLQKTRISWVSWWRNKGENHFTGIRLVELIMSNFQLLLRPLHTWNFGRIECIWFSNNG